MYNDCTLQIGKCTPGGTCNIPDLEPLLYTISVEGQLSSYDNTSWNHSKVYQS